MYPITNSFDIYHDFSRDMKLNASLNPHEEIQNWVITAIKKILPNINNHVFKNFHLGTPSSYIEADYAISTFFLTEEFIQDAASVAICIAQNCSNECIPLVKKIYAVGPYVNIQVNKPMYYEEAVNHILSQKNVFGTFKRENPLSIYINYLDRDMRAQLIGQVIGRHYENGGYTVTHNEFILDNAEIISVGREVVNDALKYRVAEYVSNTNVVMTLPTKHSPSIILQRYDRSLTRDTLYLAFNKILILKGRPSRLIYVTQMDQSKTIEVLIANMTLLKHIGPETKTSTVVVNQSDLHQHVLSKGLAAKHAVLRVPIDKKIFLNEKELMVYSYLENVIHRLNQNSQKSINMDFEVAKLLISFPDVVAKVTDSHSPDILCAYLEKVAELCDKRSVYKDNRLSRAASIVLRNGLKLLFS